MGGSYSWRAGTVQGTTLLLITLLVPLRVRLRRPQRAEFELSFEEEITLRQNQRLSEKVREVGWSGLGSRNELKVSRT